MQAVAQKIVVVGGNGFIGSAICKVAVARGMEVTSISTSGRPYRTPKGHSPAWTSKVAWHAGDALAPDTYAPLLAGAHGVVHALGTLLEGGAYKAAVRAGDALGVLGALAGALTGGGANPLAPPDARPASYAALNRDSALRVCETFVAAEPAPDTGHPRPFVYLSAEDIFRPVVPVGYIASKRAAEAQLTALLADKPAFRPVFVRPSLVYHAHFRPLASPLAVLLDASAALHAAAPRGLPTPAGALRALADAAAPGGAAAHAVPPAPASVANALTLPPIHVDHVAEAVVAALDPARADVRGPLGVLAMRELIGWKWKGAARPEGASVH